MKGHEAKDEDAKGDDAKSFGGKEKETNSRNVMNKY